MRFNRDKRGYETTALVEQGSRRRGRGGQRLLYWFRTPPGVRVGRAALDEQGMRLLEEHNPDVDFDWPRILRDAPADHGYRERDREARDRDPRDRDRRDRRESRPPQRPRPLETTAAAVPPAESPAVHDREADDADARAAAHAELVLSEPSLGAEPLELLEPSSSLVERAEFSEAGASEELREPDEVPSESLAVTHGEPLAADHAEYLEYAATFASVTHHHHAAQAHGTSGTHPAAARLGADGVVRLRLRYTQLVARLAEKPMEDDARAELNAQIERLNPDAWLTADEVAAALEQYESVYERLRSVVGHYPPRRRRR